MGIFTKIKSVVMASTASKIVTASVVVAVLGGGVVGLTCPAAFSGAESTVARAAMATFGGQTSSAEEVFGLETWSAALKEQGAELSAKVSVKELSLSELGIGDVTLPNVGFHLSAKVTPQREISAVLDAKVANTTLLTGNAYLNKDRLLVNVPKLFQSVLTLNYSDGAIEEQMKSSYAADYLGLTDAQIEELVDYLPKQTTTVSKKEIQKKLVEIVVGAYQDNLADKRITKFEKAGKEEIYDNNQVQKCKVYTATMDARYFTEFLFEVTVCTKAYFKELCVVQGIEESMADEWFQPVDTAVHQLKFGMLDTITWTFYVCEDRLVRICGNWTIDWADEVGSCTRPGALEFVLAPEGNPLENMRFHIDTPIHYDDSIKNVPQVIDFICQTTTENTENAYGTRYYVKNDGEEYIICFDYEKLAGDFTLEAAVQEQKYILTGAIGELEKGRKIGLELDTYTYAEGSYVEEQELDAEVSVKVLEGEVTALAGTQQDVLQMTEKDFAALEAEISKNIARLLFSMLGLFQ